MLLRADYRVAQGSITQRYSDIKNYPLFKNIDWDALLWKELDLPFKPAKVFLKDNVESNQGKVLDSTGGPALEQSVLHDSSYELNPVSMLASAQSMPTVCLLSDLTQRQDAA